jgi:hypothetical protein
MAVIDEIKWFKDQFAGDVVPALAGTLLSFDLICAIAFQESGELWSKLRLHLPRDEVLRLACGDTLDAPNRSAFPKNKDALIALPKGQQMFDMAHQLLVQMGDGTGIEAYQHLGTRPDKFVHGYGIFQYDLQFFLRDPNFFLEQRWKSISACVEKLMAELAKALGQLGFSNKTSLTDLESAFVGIVYNIGFGNFKESKGLQQGFNDGTHFYGENIDRFLQIARTVPTPALGGAAGVSMPAMPLGPYVVNVRTDLKLRGGPGAEFPILKSLANGTGVNVLEFDDGSGGRWALVDLEGDGTKDGYVFAKFIDPVAS